MFGSGVKRTFSFWCSAGHSWASLDVPAPVHRALVAAGYPSPTMTQSLALGALRERPAALHLGMQTGTGKTLAFLLPILERLQSNLSGPVLVLAPSLELCHQIASVCNRIVSNLDNGPVCAHVRPLMVPTRLNEAGILIATPIGAERILAPKGVLAAVATVVVDEADFMLNGGSGHEKSLKSILQTTSRRGDVHHTFVGATLPPFAARHLARLFPDMQSIRGENCISSNVKRLYVPYSGVVVARLKDVIVPGERALVFCNTSAMADKTVAECRWLRKAALFSRTASAEERCLLIDAFNDKQIDVLVCTDSAARGIDFVDVDHVIELPLALDGTNHLHRVGRTGRCGRPGRSTAFYDDTRMALVSALQNAEPGHSVATAFSRKRSFRKKQKKSSSVVANC